MRKRLSHFKTMVKKADLYNNTDSEIIRFLNLNRLYIIGFIVLLALGFLYFKFKND